MKILLIVMLMIACLQKLSEEFLSSFEELESVPFAVVKRLWMDKGVQSAYARRREFQLLDSAN